MAEPIVLKDEGGLGDDEEDPDDKDEQPDDENDDCNNDDKVEITVGEDDNAEDGELGENANTEDDGEDADDGVSEMALMESRATQPTLLLLKPLSLFEPPEGSLHHFSLVPTMLKSIDQDAPDSRHGSKLKLRAKWTPSGRLPRGPAIYNR